jgi:hypothetical protein
MHLFSADYSSKVAAFTALGLDIDVLLIGFKSTSYVRIILRHESVCVSSRNPPGFEVLCCTPSYS